MLKLTALNFEGHSQIDVSYINRMFFQHLDYIRFARKPSCRNQANLVNWDENVHVIIPSQ